MALTQLNLSPVESGDLKDAFAVFNQVSSELGGYFKLLESKVDKLNRELVASRSERIRELTEKEKLAAQLSSLIDALPAGLVVLDPDFKVLQGNAQAVELLGKSVVGSDWRAVISAPDFAE
ncbi:MAG: PAS domain-containing protein, partial [Pseudomonadales bacterium]|nr:PAS domain-containing protein [Pseudomonadales bacterium]